MGSGARVGAVAAAIAMALGIAAPAAAQDGEGYRWAVPEWRETWTGGDLTDDRGFAIEATDEAVYVAGVSGAGDGGGDLLLQRRDLDGTLRWSREWGGKELDQAHGIAIVGDDVYVVGSEASRGDGTPQSVLLRFDTNGEILDELVFNVGRTSSAQAVVAHGDSLYVAGLAHPTDPNRDLYLARIRRDGLERVWTKRWGGAKWDEAWDLDTDGERLYVAGYTTDPETDKTDNLLLIADVEDGRLEREVVWGGPGNDEARGIEIEGDTLWIAGGGQRGTSGDAYLAKASLAGDVEWTRYASGLASGAYSLSVGEQGIYVAGGSYDFPAGGDVAVLRFDREGQVEWSQIFGHPGFWDWGFDVDAHDGRFYVTGTLHTPGPRWYEILTVAYDEDLRFAELEPTVRGVAAGDRDAQAAFDAFWLGDLVRWARGPKAEGESGPQRDADGGWADEDAEGESPDGDPGGAARVYWHGGSDFGRERGHVYADTSKDEPVGHDNAPETFAGLARDMPSNPALVRNFTGVRASLLDGTIRFRYFISHDRLIPQGGFLTVGAFTVPLPPPPV